jgi:hypothetical protein
MILPAVFTVSLTSLCYEVLLTRFFSYSQWNHLSFMVISIVLFGFGASGTALSLVERRRPGWSASFLESRGFPLALVVCSITISGSFLSVKNIPLDYFRMPVEWFQSAYLLLTFLLLLVPFFCAGGVISLAFAGRSARSGWIYFASMLGSAVGALLPAALLPLLGEGRIVFCCALLLLLLPVLQVTALRRGASRERRRRPSGTGLILTASGALFLLTGVVLLVREGALLEISPSPYKLLPQVLQFPDTAVVSRSNTIRGRLDRLESPYIRFAPGLSLKFSGLLPEAEFLVRDGDALLVLYDVPGEATVESTAEGEDRSGYFSGSLQCYAGYSIHPAGREERVLILQNGGGLSLPCAAAAGAGQVTLLLEQPGAAALYRSTYAGDRYGTAVRVVAGNLRRRLARDPERYDRIQVEAWGPSVPGMASLNQEHLLTVEAFADYLEHLRPEGVLILSRKLLLPPSDMLKIFAAAYSGLESAGIEDPAAHIILIRGWDSYTLLCSPAPFTADALAEVRDFCARLNFDLVFYDGIERGDANRFNVFAEPFHYQEIRILHRALREGRGGQYFRSYYLDVSPARDDRPFHSRFTRWSKLKLLFRSTGGRFYSLFLSGETIVLVVLIIAGLLSLVLLLLPRITVRQRAAQDRPSRSAGGTAYFLAAGGGFMFVEMAFLQGFTFVFGDPVIAFTVVLAELLILSGVGGALSARWNRRVLPPVLIVLVVCQFLLFALFGRAEQLLLQAAPAAQALGAFGLLAPIALLMGVPFPVGLRLLAPSSRLRAFGWGANGVASVMASILAIPLTMVWGISRLLLLAALCYALMLGVSILKD